MKFIVGKNSDRSIFIENTGRWDIELSSGSSCKLIVYLCGGGESEIRINLIGAGSRISVIGIILGDNSSYTLRTFQNHYAPDTKSDLLIKGLMGIDSSLRYTGRIYIDPFAQKSDAYQRNENLLLSPSATVVSSPELVIQANDVRCTHGATISYISDDQLWYLKTRGLSHDAAQNLIISGFSRHLLDLIDDNRLREKFSRRLDEFSTIRN